MQKNLALIGKYFKNIYKPTNNNLRTSSNSRNKNVDTSPRYKNDDHSGQFMNQRTVNVARARGKVGSTVVQQSGIQWFNCKEFGHFTKECRKPKRVKDFAYHKEKMLLCKQAEQGVPLQAGQYVETDDSNVIPDSPDMCEDDIQNDQNDVESDVERVALANLIANLKLDSDKDMQKNLALIAKYFKKIYKPTNNNVRTSSNSRNKNVDTTPRYKNDDHSGQFGNQRTEYRKPKRVKGSTYHKEKMLMCEQAEKGVPLQAEKYDWLADTDEEVDKQELEAHYSYMAKIQEVPTAETGINSEPVEQNDQNVVESDDDRVTLANLIANLKLDVDENKKIQKQLKKANTTLAQELKECKAILVKTSKSLGESISVQDSCQVALQNKQIEFEKYKAFNNRTID
nr:hypothetical protein [Tanacetum cinerariifolium]